MKNYLFVLVLAVFFFSACSEENKTPSEELIIFEFNVECRDGVLAFDSPQDYEDAIVFLNKSEENLTKFSDSFQFSSLFDVSTSEFINKHCDEIIGSILNADNEVIIGDILFALDFESEMVTTVNLEEIFSKKASVMDYSFEDDVISEIFDPSSLETIKKSTEAYCPSWDDGDIVLNVDDDDVPGEIDFRIRYHKLGIYFSLSAKLEKYFSEDYYLEVSTNHDICCYENNKRSETVAMIDTLNNSLDNKVKIKPYSSARRLTKYFFRAYLKAKNLDDELVLDRFVNIYCSCSGCGWTEDK